MGSIPIGGNFCPYFQGWLTDRKQFKLSKDYRSWQGSNLRGQSPLDFKSNALTTRPQLLHPLLPDRYTQKKLEMRGIEPRAFHMQSERSTTELHPPLVSAEVPQANKLLTNRHPTQERETCFAPYANWMIAIVTDKTYYVPTGGLEPPIFGLGDRRLIH